MDPAIEAYLAALELLLILILPLLLVLTLYSWRFAWRVYKVWRKNGGPEPPPRLPIAMAISLTIAGTSSAILVWSVLWRSRIGPLPEWAIPLVATATFAIIVIGYMPIVYIVAVDLIGGSSEDDGAP